MPQHLTPSSIANRTTRESVGDDFFNNPNHVYEHPTNHVEVITSVQRRRRWTASEKVRMVEETFEPGMTVSLVARRGGVAANQLFTWRRLVAQGSLTAAAVARRLCRRSIIGRCDTRNINVDQAYL
jgi:hypothetical protein